MDNILVTGGAGYIGSHVCKELSKEGFNPVTYDNLDNGDLSSVKWGPFERGDILNTSQLCSVLKKYRPKAVMHFAALAYVEESFSNPLKYYRNNIFGSQSILDSMIYENINYLIFSSTCATYGVPKNQKIDEKCDQIPISPYGTSKLIVEETLRQPKYANKIKSISLRYFNASGADPDGEVGESHDPETHLIPKTIEVSRGLSKYLNVYGNDYDTPDGTCIRDYIHVTDIARAHILALHFILKSKKSDVFNLGTGKGFSVNKIIKEIERQSGKKIKIKIIKRRNGDPAILIANADKAKKILKWEPKYSSIRQIINTALSWK
jgi:UDP-glucose-4-epimerase GalE